MTYNKRNKLFLLGSCGTMYQWTCHVFFPCHLILRPGIDYETITSSSGAFDAEVLKLPLGTERQPRAGERSSTG